MSLQSRKTLKKFPSDQSEQLDLVETINDVDKAKKKRLSIIIFLFLTIGVSCIFWFYRRFQSLDFKKIKIPTITLSKFSPDIPQDWNFSLRGLDTTQFTYTSNFDTSTSFDHLTAIHDPSFAKKYLPSGVSVSEKINQTDLFTEILSQVSTPKIKFQIYVKIPGKLNPDSPQIDNFSQLVSTFYWHLLK